MRAGLRYDAAIIGAGAEGLIAAALLARAGAKTVLIERAEVPGGRLATREFHPGFHASPYADELPPVPPRLHWALDLTRRGAMFVRQRSVAVWPDGRNETDSTDYGAAARFLRHCEKMAELARIRATTPARRQRFRFAERARPNKSMSWPGAEVIGLALQNVLDQSIADPRDRVHVAAIVLSGRSADPAIEGSAAHLLAPGQGLGGIMPGGLVRLRDALLDAANSAGAEIRCGMEVGEIRRDRRRGALAVMSDGSEIAARAIVSALDCKRTFLSLFPWRALPMDFVRSTGQFRCSGSAARVLFALERAPERNSQLMRNVVHVAPDLQCFALAHCAWRAGTIAPKLPVTLRFPSVFDPRLAPPGAAVMTATLGCVPFRPFDGAWTKAKRDALRDIALVAAESVWPGVGASIRAAEVVVPADMETELGTTQGDLDGGEIAADQMLDLRPGPRTAIDGVYLGSRSAAAGPLGTGVAALAAAQCALADLKRPA